MGLIEDYGPLSAVDGNPPLNFKQLVVFSLRPIFKPTSPKKTAGHSRTPWDSPALDGLQVPKVPCKDLDPWFLGPPSATSSPSPAKPSSSAHR